MWFSRRRKTFIRQEFGCKKWINQQNSSFKRWVSRNKLSPWFFHSSWYNYKRFRSSEKRLCYKSAQSKRGAELRSIFLSLLSLIFSCINLFRSTSSIGSSSPKYLIMSTGSMKPSLSKSKSRNAFLTDTHIS